MTERNSRQPKTSSPPRNPKDYTDFLNITTTDYGRRFEWLELHLFDQEATRFSPVSVTKGGLRNANIR